MLEEELNILDKNALDLNKNDKYPGDSPGGELLAFSLMEWTIAQQHLQLFNTLATVYCHQFRNLKKTDNYRGYWPQRGIVARKCCFQCNVEVALDNHLWLDHGVMMWKLIVYSRVSLPIVLLKDKVYVNAVLTNDDMSDYEILNSYLNDYIEIYKAAVAEYRIIPRIGS